MEKLSTSTLSSENKTRTTEENSGRICGVSRGEIVQCSLVKSALNDFESVLTFFFDNNVLRSERPRSPKICVSQVSFRLRTLKIVVKKRFVPSLV